jgi:hypothetical protein
MKRQNIYYIKLQEKLATLDCGKNYVLKITSIKDNITSDEEVVIQKKDAEKSQGNKSLFFFEHFFDCELNSLAVTL